MNKIFLLFFMASLTIKAGVFMSGEMQGIIDQAAIPENGEIGSDYLKNEYLRLMNYLEKYSVQSDNSFKEHIIAYRNTTQGQESFDGLLLLALLLGLEFSIDYEFPYIMHPVNTTKKTMLDFIGQYGFENYIAMLVNEWPPHLQYFKPVILLDHGTFALEDYFYALKMGVALFTLPGTCMNDIHAGLFYSPLEVINHDVNHLYDTFGSNGEVLVDQMKFLGEKVWEIKNKNPQVLNEAMWGRTLFLLFVISHEPRIRNRFEQTEKYDIVSFIKFLEKNLKDHFENNFSNLGKKYDFYASHFPALEIAEIKDFEDKTWIIYTNHKRKECSMLDKYENLKTLYCDYAKLLKFIFPGEELLEGTDSELDWNPKYVITKYQEAFDWFWDNIAPSF